MWDDQEQTIWQSRFDFVPSTDGTASMSTMSPAQVRFYHNYLNGLFTSLGMSDVAAAFEADGTSQDDAFVNVDDGESHMPE